MEEIWKQVKDYENYEVSSFGNVKNTKTCRVLKPYIDAQGYYHVRLYKNNVGKTITIHKLVAIAFLNHKPNGHKLVIDHKNDIKTDNRLENLQILTQRENAFKTQKNYSSNYKGVSWHKQTNKWRAQIRINGKPNHLGLFTSEIEASNAYQNKLNQLSC